MAFRRGIDFVSVAASRGYVRLARDNRKLKFHVGAPLIELLTPGTVLLAAGQRLGRHLAQEFARECRALGKEVWETPDIVTWPVWIERMWLEASEALALPELLLAPAQALALWERVIRERQDGASLLQPAAAARLAQQAWELAQAWRLRLTDAEAVSDEAQAFRRWAARYQQLCHEHRWLDAARLPDRLRELIAARRLPPPARLVFAEFDELSPQQRELLDALRAVGSTVEMRQDVPGTAEAQRLALPAASDEIATAAQWVRARLLANPAARIALIVPNLSARRAAIARALDDVLLPQGVLPGQLEVERPFNFSLGLPLSDYPLVRTALRLIESGGQHRAEGRLDIEAVSLLLRSPFLGAADAERTCRALLDAELRETREPLVRLQFLHDLALATNREGEPRAHQCPQLAPRLAAWRGMLDELPRNQSAGRWAVAFAAQLRALGWPGERTPNSHEYQTLEAWRELLSGLSGLEAVLGPLDYPEALHQLRRLAQDRLFQPKTPEVPVQVLGVLEASGLVFDHVWIMGLDDEQWPPAASPNPLLPIALQRRLGLPHAAPERELVFARRATARMLASAREVIVSHAQTEGDRLLHPSPLIASLPAVELAATLPARAPFYREAMHASGALETVVDAQAPAWPGGVAAGGTRVLKSQSDCPFKAFAEFRLGATEPARPEVGLGPMDRGILLHRALEAAWNALGTHERLIALAPAKLQTLVAEAVDTALTSLARRRPFTLTRRFAALERERLEALLHEWLALERGRAPFAVLGAETRRALCVAGLELEARMDRVDRLRDGTLAVMDYKSGDASIGDWFGARPREPQLPIYSLYGVAAADVGALAFARVKRGDCGFRGLSPAADVLPGVDALGESKYADQHASWTQLQTNWRQTLETLARQFLAGDAAVDPRDARSCRECSFHSLCRIHELNERAGRLTLEDADD